MMTENNLICLNTKFEKKDGKKWTFKYPNGDKAQIDFILINRKVESGVMVQQTVNLTIASAVWDLITELSQLMFISFCELTRLKPQDPLDMIGPL